MAILFMDGFDHYLTNDGAAVGTALNGNYVTNLSDYFYGNIRTMPALGGKGLWLGPGLGTVIHTGRVVYPLPEPKTSGWIAAGFHIYYTSLSNSQRTFAFGGGVTTSYASFTINTNGNFVIYPGTTGSALATSDLSYSIDTLYHIEFRLTFGNPGSIELRVDGQTVLSVPHVLTSPVTDCKFLAANTGSANSSYFHLKNFYLCDDTGDVNNDWLGERNIYTLRPNADATPQDWTLSGGSDAYALINQTPPDPDNDFIESASIGDISQFTIDDLASVDILVNAVSVHTQSSKTGTSDTALDVGVSSNSVTDAVTHTLVQDQALWNSSVFEVNPDTEESWTPAEVNSLEVFVERSL